jgi:uncharacterized protein (DUF1015 family)
MPEIKPFRAVIYNKDRIKDLSRVVSPPYDVISDTLQDKLYRSSPHNIARLILGKIKPSDSASDNRYTRAAHDFNDWRASGIMVRDPKDSLYVYSQSYRKDGKTVEQIGFLALFGLTGSRILPHENTLAAPKKDRLELMRATSANLEPIFVLYDDKKHALTGLLKRDRKAAKPFIDISYENVRHRMWRIDDAAKIKRTLSLASKKEMFIADGHHRFDVAKMFNEEAKTKDSGYMMIYFVEYDEKMLTVLPAHRIIKDTGALTESAMLKKLEPFFRIKKAAALEAMMSAIEEKRNIHAFGMYAGGRNFYVLELKDEKASDKAIADKPSRWKHLDVSILHLFLFQRVVGIRDDDDNIEFVKDPARAVSAVKSGKFKSAFFLNPTKVAQVIQIARLGERMPRKATYFYPKPLSGLVINLLAS